ncbi:hypothetical protein [Aestuariicoccus sp. MJ-SS9]|uniref:hypothetical protein n=1 Tax=Aestuariicoccus sp. MJ-SS9 TaxID=3079855 RepID=UPI002914ABB9|nr:hypothetical protein [Aestuariicoccus sp. MJ-SS9]MDU8911329.1 hypothetical protein [Aestuariicoccus sp. MJ-SS9]
MPDEDIFRPLKIELDPGEVKFSAPAQKHALKRHPNDVPLIVPHLSQILSAPTYLGDDHRNPGKIEIVGRISGVAGAALVALTVKKDETDGYYHVCSSYFITQSELDKKRDKGILKIVKPRTRT